MPTPFAKTFLALLMVLWATGCADGRARNECLLFTAPIILTEAEDRVLTRGSREQVVTYNETGERHCGWRPAR